MYSNLRRITFLCLLLCNINSASAYTLVDRIVAVVNDDIVMLSELNASLQDIYMQFDRSPQRAQLPPLDVLQKQLLDKLIENQVQLQRAEILGISVDDEVLNLALSNIAKGNNVSLTEFREIIEQDGYNYSQFRQSIREKIILQRLQQQEVESRISITEEEINNFLSTQDRQIKMNQKLRLGHILISTQADDSDEDKQNAIQIAENTLQELHSGEPFQALAQRVSDGQNAQNGGDLGWRTYEQIPSLFVEYVRDMQKSDISPLIQSPSGIHIITLLDVEDDVETPEQLEQVYLRHILLTLKDSLAEADVQARLSDYKQQIKDGADFAMLAKSYSDDIKSAMLGGELGWVNLADLDADFQQIIDTLPINQISEPFKSSSGWHIVQILEKRAYADPATKRNEAKLIIYEKKLKEALEHWNRELLGEAYIEYRLDES